MSSVIKAVSLMILFGAFLHSSSSRAMSDAFLASQLRSALAAVSSGTSLAVWKGSHTRELVDLAHYETDTDPYEIDLSRENQWCATSVAHIAPGVTRAASFYVPQVTQGELSPFPPKPDASLTDSCGLGEFWYEAPGRNLASDVVKELSAYWGPPNRTTPKDFYRSVYIRGAGSWKNVMGWQRGSVSIWVGWTDWSKGNGIGSRTVMWIGHERPQDMDLSAIGFDVMAAALKMADLSSELTAQISPNANCAGLGGKIATARLARWLTAARSLPTERRAAALVAADSFVPCALASGATASSVGALSGVKLEIRCPQDGPAYTGSLRKQAEALDGSGPAAALAAVAALQHPCSLDDSGPWPNGVIDHGRRILRQFGSGPWSPWVHFAIARAHEVKLSFSLPPGEVDLGVVHDLTPTQTKEERSAAIAEFAYFIREQPDAKEAVFARQEAWRLMAGLPPSPTHFGCNCE